MLLCKWERLPRNMQNDAVRKYYDILKKKSVSLVCKRIFDIVASFAMLILFSPMFLILAIAIKLDSKGPIFYRQVRITQYGKEFRIHKFRSMCDGADKKGSLVTVDHDSRITKVGRFIRDKRLDEVAQLIDVFEGNMTFVGTRPEVKKHISSYTDEMMATLLLPAGVTSLASICFKDEARMLRDAVDADETYAREILPLKMRLNLKGIEQFSLIGDIKLMFMTVFAVLGKRYSSENN